MRDIDANELAAKVKQAMEWTPSDPLLDAVSEQFSVEEAGRRPIIVRNCCRQCIFLNPNDSCENFQAPEGLPGREPGEWIPIPPSLAASMGCKAWIELELGRLLLRGHRAGGIANRRRHPKLEVVPDGAQNFTSHLASLPRRLQASQAKGTAVADPQWPEMDPRLREILMAVEQRGNQEMWSQYQGALFMMGVMTYLNAMFDRLLQKPDSPVGEFLRYVVKTHGYHYGAMFGMVGAPGAATFERILGLLEQDSEVLREIAGQVLEAISRSSRYQAPENPADPYAWREWAEQQYKFNWKPRGA